MKIKKNIWRYYYFTSAYRKPWWHDLQFLRCRVRQTEIDNYGSFFAFLPPPPKNPKNQNFEEMKKKAGDIIILHKLTKNHNHMRYRSWDTEWENSLSLWVIFYPFNPPKDPKNQKSKFWKHEKSIWRCHHFAHVYQKSLSYNWPYDGVGQTIFGHFGPFFALLP